MKCASSSPSSFENLLQKGLSEDSTMTMISDKYDDDNLSGRMHHTASVVEVSN